MTTKKDIEKLFEEQLDSFSNKIDKLEEKMKQEKAHASELEHKAIKNLIAMRSEAKRKANCIASKSLGKKNGKSLGLA